MTEETLLPCPFCGGEANISPYTRIGVSGAAGFYAECDNCSSGGEPFDIQGNMPDAEDLALSRAIAAWNTRTTTDLQARLDAAEAKNAEMVGLMCNLASIDHQWVDAQGGAYAAIDRIIGEAKRHLPRTSMGARAMVEVTQAANALTVKLTEWLIMHDVLDEEGPGLQRTEAFGEFCDDLLQAALAHKAPARTRKELEEQRGEPTPPNRADLTQWQTDQSEWFDDTILEIVGEYADWRDAQQAQEGRKKTFQVDHAAGTLRPTATPQAENEALKARVAVLEGAAERYRHTLKMISIVEQGCGGNLTFQEMANSAMSQARQALSQTGDA